MINRPDIPEEKKRQIAEKHTRKVTTYKILFAVSLFIILVSVAALDKLNDTVIKAGIRGGSGLMLLSMLNLNVANYCPFCHIKMDNRIGPRSPLMMDFPATCPFCGEKLRYW